MVRDAGPEPEQCQTAGTRNAEGKKHPALHADGLADGHCKRKTAAQTGALYTGPDIRVRHKGSD